MQYRDDPRSGNRISALGFGLMRLPRGLTGIDQAKATALVRQAIAAGVNYFDTAYVYPGSEVALGRALSELAEEGLTATPATPGGAGGAATTTTSLRDGIYLATKLPHQQVRSSADLDRIFAEQLRRLATDRIDYYLIHNLPAVAPWRRIVGLGADTWLREQQRTGRIGQVGFSFHGGQADFLEVLDAYDWDFVQIQYNYLDVNYQAGRTGLAAAAERGKMAVIMEPLRGGKLAAGLPLLAAGLLDGAEPGSSAASWALRWVFDQSEPTVVLSGMGTPEQLSDNLQTADKAVPGMLTPSQRRTIDQVVEAFQAAYRIPCTGCGYCMPCPHGVNIPDCFMALNTRLAQGRIAGWSQYFPGISPHSRDRYSGPGRCEACGACERKCPQGIAVIESLGEVRQAMEPLWIRPVLAMLRRSSG
jgi:predicted aldo/keto reductase-like oxidoreductase